MPSSRPTLGEIRLLQERQQRQLDEHESRLNTINGQIGLALQELKDGKVERHEFRDQLAVMAKGLDRMNKAQDRRDIIAEAQATFLREQTDAKDKADIRRNQSWALRISLAVAIVAALALLLQAAGVWSSLAG